MDLDIQMTEARTNNLTSKTDRLKPRLEKPQRELLACVLELEIYDWGHGKDISSFKPAVRNKMIEENYEALSKIDGYSRETSRLHKITGSKWKQD